MVLKCSECGGEVRKISNGKFRCTQCGRERTIEESKTIDMGKDSNLSVLMEWNMTLEEILEDERNRSFWYRYFQWRKKVEKIKSKNH